jgi:hypothetical protein
VQMSTIIDWNSSESVEALTPSIVEGAFEGIESCTNTRQRLILYLSESNILTSKWDNICATLGLYYFYSLVPREADIGSNATANLSRTLIGFTNDKLGLGFTETQLENLSAELNNTEYYKDIQQVRGTIINNTQDLMNRIIGSDLVGY